MPADVELEFDEQGKRIGARLKSDGEPVESDGIRTMSKSKNNGVDPQALIDQYGADTARFFMMFASPPEDTLAWNDDGVEGAYRYLKRIWSFGYRLKEELIQDGGIPAILNVDSNMLDAKQSESRRQMHTILKQASFDMERQQFNTVASAAMKILNVLDDASLAMFNYRQDIQGSHAKARQARNSIYKEGTAILLRMLAPISPHIAQTLWRELGFGMDILDAPWPVVDELALVQDEIDMVLQVNGKLRGSIRVPTNASRELIDVLARRDPAAIRHIADQTVKKVIVVPGRLVNIVV